MSIGSKIIPVRFDEASYTALGAAMAASNKANRGEIHSISSFIRKCVADKIAHQARSKRRKPATAIESEATPVEPVALDKPAEPVIESLPADATNPA